MLIAKYVEGKYIKNCTAPLARIFIFYFMYYNTNIMPNWISTTGSKSGMFEGACRSTSLPLLPGSLAVVGSLLGLADQLNMVMANLVNNN